MWVDEYVNLVFGEGYNDHSINEGTRLKNHNMPDLLYKYRKATDEHIESLEGDFLYSSQLTELSDPFELALRLSSDEISRNLHTKALQNIRKDYPSIPEQSLQSGKDFFVNIAVSLGVDRDVILHDIENDPSVSPMYNLLTRFDDIINAIALRDILERAKTAYNVCSLSATHDSSAMWDYYSGGHTGFCMGYAIKSLGNDITDLTLPIIYVDDYVHIKDIEKLNTSVCMYAMTVKSTEYVHEREWRIFYRHNPPKHKEGMPVPKVVYLGAKMTDENRERITKICDSKGIYVLQKNYTQHHII